MEEEDGPWLGRDVCVKVRERKEEFAELTCRDEIEEDGGVAECGYVDLFYGRI